MWFVSAPKPFSECFQWQWWRTISLETLIARVKAPYWDPGAACHFQSATNEVWWHIISGHVWLHLWISRKMAETYLIIEQTAWRTDFQPIIACLRGVLRDRVIQSIRETYLSIDIQLAAQMLGFSFVNADFQACKKRILMSRTSFWLCD